jgi:hypothetical protein
MKKQYLVYGIIAVVFLVAILTNPSQDRHKEVLKTKLNAFMQKTLKETPVDPTNPFAQAGQTFGIMLGDLMVDKILGSLVSTDNYLIFSTTKLTIDGEPKVIGFGAFGNVFLSGKIDEALDNGLLKNEDNK